MNTSLVQVGESAQDDPIAPGTNGMSAFVEEHVNVRGKQWTQAIEAELQDLVVQASQLRQLINSSKTGAKKKYYQKKFAKISTQVHQMVAALQRVQANTNTSINTNAPVNTTV